MVLNTTKILIGIKILTISGFVVALLVTQREILKAFLMSFLHEKNASKFYRHYVLPIKDKKRHPDAIEMSRLTEWGAIRESNPFMLGSQPSVFTVSPIAPREQSIEIPPAFYKTENACAQRSSRAFKRTGNSRLFTNPATPWLSCFSYREINSSNGTMSVCWI